MQHGTLAVPLEERGVYWARHRRDGYPVLYAVDSRGDVLKPMLVIRDMAYADAAIDRLRALLDRRDPIRRIALVTDEELAVRRRHEMAMQRTALITLIH